MFECEITVKAGSNAPSKKKDSVGPVDSFFRNYTACYTAVKNHVLECPKCCPEEALERFLATRDKPSLNEFTSAGLVRLALQMEKGCEGRPGKRVPRRAVNEFIVRSGHPPDLVRHAARLDPSETVRALGQIWRQWSENQNKSWRKGRPVLDFFLRSHENAGQAGKVAYWMVRTVAVEFDAGRPFPPLDDLERLATVAEVMFG